MIIGEQTMSNLLNAANTNSDGFIIGELPTESGTVSIMTLEQLYKALGGTGRCGSGWDTMVSFNYSTLLIYAINDMSDTNDALFNSTIANLQAVSLDWYKQRNTPFYRGTHFENAGSGTHSVFGGLLHSVVNKHGSYYFKWYYYDDSIDRSYSIDYWHDFVPGDVYVAVVRK